MATYTDWVEHNEQASAPATPTTGHWRLFFKSDGIYFVDDAGTVSGPLPTSALSNPMTTAGDIITGGASGTPARLSIGSALQHLRVNAGGTALEYADPPSGSSASLSYLGYNTIGASTEVMTNLRWYVKKITTVGAAQLLSIGGHIKWGADTFGQMVVGVFEDNSGSPLKVLAGNHIGSVLDLSEGSATRNFRWFDVPVALELAAATSYWIGLQLTEATTQPSIHYDGSGSDRYWNGSGQVAISDATYFSNTTTTNNYSIRARILS